MNFKNQINKEQRKKDVIVTSIFLVLSTLGMFTFFLIELFMWTFNIYFTPYFFVGCILLLLCIIFLFGLIIVLKPFVKVSENTLLCVDSFNKRKKIPLTWISTITTKSNQVIFDGKYKSDTVIIDIFYGNKSARFALAEKDYNEFINNSIIAEKTHK